MISTVIGLMLVVPAEERQVIERVFIENSDLYADYVGSRSPKRLTTDGRRKEFIAVSQDGRRVAYVINSQQQALGTIAVLSSEGATLNEITFRPEKTSTGAMRYIEELGWLSPDRLVISGSFSPLAAEYVVVDANTGKELHSYFVAGHSWTPSPGGAHVIYEYYVPLSTYEEDRRPRLCLDDECRADGTGGYPAQGRHVEFQRKPIWSDDGSAVSIVASDVDRNGRKVVIVKRVKGTVDELVMPHEARDDAAVSWEGPDVVLSSARLRWKVNANWSGFERIKR